MASPKRSEAQKGTAKASDEDMHDDDMGFFVAESEIPPEIMQHVMAQYQQASSGQRVTEVTLTPEQAQRMSQFVNSAFERSRSTSSKTACSSNNAAGVQSKSSSKQQAASAGSPASSSSKAAAVSSTSPASQELGVLANQLHSGPVLARMALAGQQSSMVGFLKVCLPHCLQTCTDRTPDADIPQFIRFMVRSDTSYQVRSSIVASEMTENLAHLRQYLPDSKAYLSFQAACASIESALLAAIPAVLQQHAKCVRDSVDLCAMACQAGRAAMVYLIVMHSAAAGDAETVWRQKANKACSLLRVSLRECDIEAAASCSPSDVTGIDIDDLPTAKAEDLLPGGDDHMVAELSADGGLMQTSAADTAAVAAAASASAGKAGASTTAARSASAKAATSPAAAAAAAAAGTVASPAAAGEDEGSASWGTKGGLSGFQGLFQRKGSSSSSKPAKHLDKPNAATAGSSSSRASQPASSSGDANKHPATAGTTVQKKQGSLANGNAMILALAGARFETAPMIDVFKHYFLQFQQHSMTPPPPAAAAAAAAGGSGEPGLLIGSDTANQELITAVNDCLTTALSAVRHLISADIQPIFEQECSNVITACRVALTAVLRDQSSTAIDPDVMYAAATAAGRGALGYLVSWHSTVAEGESLEACEARAQQVIDLLGMVDYDEYLDQEESSSTAAAAGSKLQQSVGSAGNASSRGGKVSPVVDISSGGSGTTAAGLQQGFRAEGFDMADMADIQLARPPEQHSSSSSHANATTRSSPQPSRTPGSSSGSKFKIASSSRRNPFASYWHKVPAPQHVSAAGEALLKVAYEGLAPSAIVPILQQYLTATVQQPIPPVLAEIPPGSNWQVNSQAEQLHFVAAVDESLLDCVNCVGDQVPAAEVVQGCAAIRSAMRMALTEWLQQDAAQGADANVLFYAAVHIARTNITLLLAHSFSSGECESKQLISTRNALLCFLMGARNVPEQAVEALISHMPDNISSDPAVARLVAQVRKKQADMADRRRAETNSNMQETAAAADGSKAAETAGKGAAKKQQSSQSVKGGLLGLSKPSSSSKAAQTACNASKPGSSSSSNAAAADSNSSVFGVPWDAPFIPMHVFETGQSLLGMALGGFPPSTVVPELKQYFTDSLREPIETAAVAVEVPAGVHWELGSSSGNARFVTAVNSALANTLKYIRSALPLEALPRLEDACARIKSAVQIALAEWLQDQQRRRRLPSVDVRNLFFSAVQIGRAAMVLLVSFQFNVPKDADAADDDDDSLFEDDHLSARTLLICWLMGNRNLDGSVTRMIHNMSDDVKSDKYVSALIKAARLKLADMNAAAAAAVGDTAATAPATDASSSSSSKTQATGSNVGSAAASSTTAAAAGTSSVKQEHSSKSIKGGLTGLEGRSNTSSSRKQAAKQASKPSSSSNNASPFDCIGWGLPHIPGHVFQTGQALLCMAMDDTPPASVVPTVKQYLTNTLVDSIDSAAVEAERPAGVTWVLGTSSGKQQFIAAVDSALADSLRYMRGTMPTDAVPRVEKACMRIRTAVQLALTEWLQQQQQEVTTAAAADKLYYSVLQIGRVAMILLVSFGFPTPDADDLDSMAARTLLICWLMGARRLDDDVDDMINNMSHDVKRDRHVTALIRAARQKQADLAAAGSGAAKAVDKAAAAAVSGSSSAGGSSSMGSSSAGYSSGSSSSSSSGASPTVRELISEPVITASNTLLELAVGKLKSQVAAMELYGFLIDSLNPTTPAAAAVAAAAAALSADVWAVGSEHGNNMFLDAVERALVNSYTSITAYVPADDCARFEACCKYMRNCIRVVLKGFLLENVLGSSDTKLMFCAATQLGRMSIVLLLLPMIQKSDESDQSAAAKMIISGYLMGMQQLAIHVEGFIGVIPSEDIAKNAVISQLVAAARAKLAATAETAAAAGENKAAADVPATAAIRAAVKEVVGKTARSGWGSKGGLSGFKGMFQRPGNSSSSSSGAAATAAGKASEAMKAVDDTAAAAAAAADHPVARDEYEDASQPNPGSQGNISSSSSSFKVLAAGTFESSGPEAAMTAVPFPDHMLADLKALAARGAAAELKAAKLRNRQQQQQTATGSQPQQPSDNSSSSSGAGSSKTVAAAATGVNKPDAAPAAAAAMDTASAEPKAAAVVAAAAEQISAQPKTAAAAAGSAAAKDSTSDALQQQQQTVTGTQTQQPNSSSSCGGSGKSKQKQRKKLKRQQQSNPLTAAAVDEEAVIAKFCSPAIFALPDDLLATPDELAVICKLKLHMKLQAASNQQRPFYNVSGWSALHYAVASHKMFLVQQLINAGADVAAPEPLLQLTPLHLACMGKIKDQQQFQEMKRAADISLYHFQDYCSRYGYASRPIVNMLLVKRVDPNCQVASGPLAFFAPLHILSCRDTYKDRTSGVGRSSSSSSSGVGVGVEGMKCQLATMQNHLNCLVDLLDAGADVDLIKQPNQETLLTFAARCDAFYVLKCLHDHDRVSSSRVVELVNKPRKLDGARPLEVAIHEGNVAMAMSLLKAGATVVPMHPPAAAAAAATLDLPADLRPELCLLYAVQLTAYPGRVLLLQQLLAEGGDIWLEQQWPATGQTALNVAVQMADAECVSLLVAAGADVSACLPPAIPPPLVEAVQKGNVEIVKTLLNAGADYGCYIHAQTGYDLLQSAASFGHMEIVITLVEAGATWSLPKNQRYKNNVIYYVPEIITADRPGLKLSFVEGRLRLAEKTHKHRRAAAAAALAGHLTGASPECTAATLALAERIGLGGVDNPISAAAAAGSGSSTTAAAAAKRTAAAAAEARPAAAAADTVNASRIIEDPLMNDVEALAAAIEGVGKKTAAAAAGSSGGSSSSKKSKKKDKQKQTKAKQQHQQQGAAEQEPAQVEEAEEAAAAAVEQQLTADHIQQQQQQEENAAVLRSSTTPTATATATAAADDADDSLQELLGDVDLQQLQQFAKKRPTQRSGKVVVAAAAASSSSSSGTPSGRTAHPGQQQQRQQQYRKQQRQQQQPLSGNGLQQEQQQQQPSPVAKQQQVYVVKQQQQQQQQEEEEQYTATMPVSAEQQPAEVITIPAAPGDEDTPAITAPDGEHPSAAAAAAPLPAAAAAIPAVLQQWRGSLNPIFMYNRPTSASSGTNSNNNSGTATPVMTETIPSQTAAAAAAAAAAMQPPPAAAAAVAQPADHNAHTAAAAAGNASGSNAPSGFKRKQCIVCLERPSNVLLLPCKHIVLCAVCADQLHARGSLKECPWCRNVCERHVKIHKV